MNARDRLNPTDLISVQADVWVRTRPTISAHAYADPTTGEWLSLSIDTEPRTGLRLMLGDPDAADALADALTWAADRARQLHATGNPDSTDQRVFTPTRPAHEPGQAA